MHIFTYIDTYIFEYQYLDMGLDPSFSGTRGHAGSPCAVAGDDWFAGATGAAWIYHRRIWMASHMVVFKEF